MTKASKKTTAAPAKGKGKAAVAAPAAPAAKNKLGKSELVELIAEKTSLSKKDAAQAFDALSDTIVEALKGGKTVGVPGLGTFSVKSTAERQGVRPGTSERITIPAGKKVSYKVASNLKSSLGAE